MNNGAISQLAPVRWPILSDPWEVPPPAEPSRQAASQNPRNPAISCDLPPIRHATTASPGLLPCGLRATRKLPVIPDLGHWVLGIPWKLRAWSLVIPPPIIDPGMHVSALYIAEVCFLSVFKTTTPPRDRGQLGRHRFTSTWSIGLWVIPGHCGHWSLVIPRSSSVLSVAHKPASPLTEGPSSRGFYTFPTFIFRLHRVAETPCPNNGQTATLGQTRNSAAEAAREE